MSKILFADLDGTLLSDDKTITEENKKAIVETVKKGNYFVLATGRTLYAVSDIIKQLNFTHPGCFVMSYNGGLITDMNSGRNIYERFLDFGIVEELFYAAEESGVYIQTYQGKKLFCNRDGEEARHYIEISKHEIHETGTDVLKYLSKEPYKCLAIDLHNKSNLDTFIYKNKERFNGLVDFYYSGPDYLELMPARANKGDGIVRLANYLNVFGQDTIAVGDQENDIAMLKVAAVGCAMKNALDCVKEAADYVTENDNNHSGIAEIIHKFMM